MASSHPIPRSVSTWLLAVLLSALSLAPAAADAPAAPDDASPKPTLQGAILVLLDTVRADHLSPYGHRRNTTPGLRDLAKRGVLFEQVVSYAPWTLPSVATILSGDRFSRGYDVDEGKLRRSIVEDIRRAGYKTAALTEGGFVSSHFAFDRGFDEFREERGPVFLTEKTADGSFAEEPIEKGAGGVRKTFGRARKWLRAHADERFFLLIHTYEPHTPYQRFFFTKNIPRGNLTKVLDGRMLKQIRSGEVEIGDKERRYTRALYDGGLRVADYELALLMIQLEKMGLSDRTLLVVTSDHGEDLGARFPQHMGDHGHALFDEQIMVPLVIADPTQRFDVTRVKSQVRTIDILPTVAELLGASPSGPIEGRSLLPLMRGEETGDRPAFGGVTQLTPLRFFVRDGGYKYIEASPQEGTPELSPAPPPVQLYDLRSDPGEERNLAAEQPNRARAFHKRLVEYLDGSGPKSGISIESETDGIDAEMRERLRSLGYLDGVD